MAAPWEYPLDAMATSLEAGFALDELYSWMEGRMQSSKRPALARLARLLAEAGTPYALIGGVAVQAHRSEPRTTLDIDVALLERGSLPRERLRAAGFRETGQHEHSDNWVGPAGTPVQFTDDPALAGAVSRAIEFPLGKVGLPVIRVADLLHEKLRAGSDQARRRSKRLQDLADVQSLLEQEPQLENELTADEKALLDRLPR